MIDITGKETMQTVYDADGNKLQKKFTPQNGTATTATTYISGFVYQADVLQYINFEEGRIRAVAAVSPGNATGSSPKAYMTIIFFDERFNYVAENNMAIAGSPRVLNQGMSLNFK